MSFGTFLMFFTQGNFGICKNVLVFHLSHLFKLIFTVKIKFDSRKSNDYILKNEQMFCIMSEKGVDKA